MPSGQSGASTGRCPAHDRRLHDHRLPAELEQFPVLLLMAGSLIAVVPVLIVALIVQRRVVEGLTLGAVR